MTILARARLALDIPVELARELDDECRRRNVTKSATVIQALTNYIAANKEENKKSYFETLKEKFDGKQVVQPKATRILHSGVTTSKRNTTRRSR